MKKIITIILALAVVFAFLPGCSRAVDVKHLKDGTYSCSVTVNGGSENELIQSPVKISIVKGGPTALIIWKTRNIEYMMVKGQRYDPVDNAKETAGSGSEKDYPKFAIPMDFDMDFTVSALNADEDAENLTEYVLWFNSKTLSVNTETKKN